MSPFFLWQFVHEALKKRKEEKKWVGSEAKAQWARTNGDREDWGKKKQNLRETTPHPNVRPVR